MTNYAGITAVQGRILDHMVDVVGNDDPDDRFTAGFVMGLRVAYLCTGAVLDGSDESWAALLEEYARWADGVEGAGRG